MKSFKRVFGSSLVLLGLLGILFPAVSSRAATRLEQPRVVIRAAQVATPTTVGADSSEPLVWQARLVEVVPDVILGGGAIMRVYVHDRPGEVIELQMEDTVLRNTAGSKAEYGDDAAEFAPLQGGVWLVSVPALNSSITIETDYRSLFIVEFYQIPAAQATAIAQGSATPTPLGGANWEGQVTSRSQGPSVAGAMLLVKVEGRSGQPVDLSTFTDYIGQGVTGSKPDQASDVVEFAGLADGQYIITPLGLNASLTVDLAVNTTTEVVFSPVQSAPEPTSTATPPPQPATNTPLPVSPTTTPSATSSPSPTATAPPPQRWLALVENREAISQRTPRLIVRVDGQPDEEVSIQQRGVEAEVTCETGSVQGYKPAACELDDLVPGIHLVSWPAGNLSTHLELKENELVVLAFKPEPLPAEETTWQGTVVRNSSRPASTDRQNAQIEVQVAERVGQVVSLLNSKRQRRLCESDQAGICRFSDLGAGVYTIEPVNIPATVALFVDGVGTAQVEFEEVALISPTPTTSAEAISGGGAVPKPVQAGAGFVRATDTPTPEPSPSPTSTPTQRPTASPTPSPTPRVQVALPTATPNPSPSPTAAPTATPTPVQGWIGTVVEDYQHPGQTIVVSVPLGDYPIVLQSGPWQSEIRTGSKPELGPGVVEFAGLAPGEYTVTLVNLAETNVTLSTDQFLHVNFAFETLPEATPTPEPGAWTGAILNNTSTPGSGGGAWSILTLQIGGVNNLPIRCSTDGYQAECITGTKPELGDGVCQIGGLWPATYRVEPANLPIDIDVTLDGQGTAWVAFWQQ